MASAPLPCGHELSAARKLESGAVYCGACLDALETAAKHPDTRHVRTDQGNSIGSEAQPADVQTGSEARTDVVVANGAGPGERVRAALEARLRAEGERAEEGGAGVP